MTIPDILNMLGNLPGQLLGGSLQMNSADEHKADFIGNGLHWPHNYDLSSLTSLSGEQLGMTLAYIVGFACAVIIICSAFRKVKSLQKMSLVTLFFITFVYGVLVYDIGMYTGEPISLFTNLPMAIIYGFKIFLLDSDVSEIHEPFHENWLYSANFALVHCLAAMVSLLFVVKYFGFSMVARYRMWKAAHGIGARGKSVDETFVFWGLNDATVALAGDIMRKMAENLGSSTYRIVVVRTNPSDEDTTEVHTGINRILDFLTMKVADLEKLENLHCLSTGTFVNLGSARRDNDSEDNCDIIGGTLRLRSLRNILRDRTSGRIHMFFLSDNEKENVHAVMLMKNDITLQRFIKPESASAAVSENFEDRSVRLFCHARRNSIHRVIEDQNDTEKIMVKVVDSSHYNVEILKHYPEMLPVNFVEVEGDATVSSDFNSLVIGFSEVGMDCVRFLYEYGAFVDASKSKDGARSSFHMDVVDKNMADLAGAFVANAPAIPLEMTFLSEEPVAEKPVTAQPESNDKAPLISLHDMDCRSVAFYRMLQKRIAGLNYIVVATEDDELNISLGVRIFKMAVRYRRDLDNLVILIRAHHDEDGHAADIIAHYNRLWAAEKAARRASFKFNQKEILRNARLNLPLFLFGLDAQIYSYDIIVGDKLERLAMEFKELYEASANPGEHKYSTDWQSKAWYLDYMQKMQTDSEHRDYAPTYSAVMNLRRTRGQDFANCAHAHTKKILAERALKKIGIPFFTWQNLNRRERTVTYQLASGEPVAQPIVSILDTLAQTEHLRWNASHEILGYTDSDTDGSRVKDEAKLIHPCITTWQNLDTVTRSYDYNVVDVTFNIINPQHPIAK